MSFFSYQKILRQASVDNLAKLNNWKLIFRTSSRSLNQSTGLTDMRKFHYSKALSNSRGQSERFMMRNRVCGNPSGALMPFFPSSKFILPSPSIVAHSRHKKLSFLLFLRLEFNNTLGWAKKFFLFTFEIYYLCIHDTLLFAVTFLLFRFHSCVDEEFPVLDELIDKLWNAFCALVVIVLRPDSLY